MKHLNGPVNDNGAFPGFIIPSEVLVLECIPNLKNEFREDVEGCNHECARMSKRKFKESGMQGYPLEEICEALGREKDNIYSFFVPDLDVELMMAHIIDDDRRTYSMMELL